jgi:hypothetical protein
MVILAPFLLALRPRWRGRDLVTLAVFPLVSYGIFLVWDAGALLEDVVLFHWKSPFRADGMTVSAFLRAEFDAPLLPSWVAPAAFVVGAAAWFRSIRNEPQGSVGGIAILWLGLATTFLSTLLLGKHAFCNYFYLVHFLLVQSAVWSRAVDGGAEVTDAS